ncbi:uncharacterized protein [Nicotiana tomentosiformis]|uniref:uncharacterized protein n=1 Tax=Nicotiana tomentosiformis TaxID=4098 RepID=UPI00388C4D78
MANLDIDNPRHPLCLQQSDNPSNVIISIQLKGTENYPVWSKAMVIALRAKRKLGFIDGSCTKSQFTEDLGEDWERVNATVLTWIMNIVSSDLINGIVYGENAHEVWLDLEDRFNKVNSSRVYNLQREVATISQGTSIISVYHSRLKSLWDEYGSLIPSLPVTAGTGDFIEHLEQQKPFQFLMGLNESYGAIRSEFMLQYPSPSVSRAFVILINEENQRKVCVSNSQISLANKMNESTVFMSTRGHQSKFKRLNDLYCEYCHFKGHSKDTCYKLHGYPHGYKGKRQQQYK